MNELLGSSQLAGTTTSSSADLPQNPSGAVEVADGVMAEDYLFPSLRLSADLIDDNLEYHRYHDSFTGLITLHGETGVYNAGFVRMRRICLRQAMEDGAPWLSIINYDQEATDVCSVVVDDRNCTWSDRVEHSLTMDLVDLNMNIIQLLMVRPEFRGLNLGLWAISLLTKKFNGLTVLRPLPLQFCFKNDIEKLRLGNYGGSKSRATTRLRKHYGLAGFKRIRGSAYMGISDACGRPSSETFLEDDVVIMPVAVLKGMDDPMGVKWADKWLGGDQG